MSIFCEIALRWRPQYLSDDSIVNIGLGNGLVLLSSKLLPELVLTQIYVSMWH